jgi:hypothetical protein
MRRIAALGFLILLAACLGPNYHVVGEIEGKYNATLISEEMTTQKGDKVTVYEVMYEYAGEEQKGILPLNMVPALDKISNDSPDNAVITMWWDYASALRGYTGREVVIDSPSPEITYSVVGGWDKKLESNSKVRDVATIMTTNSS